MASGIKQYGVMVEQDYGESPLQRGSKQTYG